MPDDLTILDLDDLSVLLVAGLVVGLAGSLVVAWLFVVSEVLAEVFVFLSLDWEVGFLSVSDVAFF